MSSLTYVVIGATRGLGLELTKQLVSLASPRGVNVSDAPLEQAAKSSNTVYATARDPSTATQLNSLAASNSNVKVLPVDFTSDASLAVRPHCSLSSASHTHILYNAGARVLPPHI